MLVGVDGSEQSARALAWAIAHASANDMAVEAIMTVPEADDAAETHAELRAAQQTVTAMIDAALDGVAHPPPVSSEVVVGDPAVVLVNASRRADLVVLGSHGRSAVGNPALGSVSVACIRMGSCPVLVIPHGGQGSP